MIKVNPSIIFDKLLSKQKEIADAFTKVENEYDSHKKEFYKNLKWWHFTRDYDSAFPMSKYRFYSVENPSNFREKYENLFTACSYAMRNNIKEIELPHEFCHVLKWE